jgi:hypothetical protein
MLKIVLGLTSLVKSTHSLCRCERYASCLEKSPRPPAPQTSLVGDAYTVLPAGSPRASQVCAPARNTPRGRVAERPEIGSRRSARARRRCWRAAPRQRRRRGRGRGRRSGRRGGPSARRRPGLRPGLQYAARAAARVRARAYCWYSPRKCQGAAVAARGEGGEAYREGPRRPARSHAHTHCGTHYGTHCGTLWRTCGTPVANNVPRNATSCHSLPAVPAPRDRSVMIYMVSFVGI